MLNESHFSLIYNNISDLVILIENIANNVYGIKSVNESFLSATGYAKEQVLGKRLEEIFPIDASNLLLDKIKKAVKLKKNISYNEIIDFPKSKLNLTAKIMPITSNEGYFTNFIWIAQHNTRLNQQENNFSELDCQNLISFFDEWDESIYVSDPNTCEILYVNRSIKEKFGNVVGKKCHRVFQGLDFRCSFCNNEVNINQNIGETNFREFMNKKNHRWYRCLDRTAKWWDGSLVRFKLFIDITEFRQTLDAQRLCEEKFRLLFNKAKDAIGLIEITAEKKPGRLIEINDIACQRLGYTREELFLLTPANFINKEDLKPEILHNLVKKGFTTFETTEISKNGDSRPVEVNLHIFKLNNKLVCMAIARDITERKLKERAVEAQNEFLQKMANTVPIPIFYKDVNGRYIGCNNSFESFIGLKNEEILGKFDYEISFKNKGDNYRKKDVELLNNPGVQVYESTYENADGSLSNLITHKATFLDSNGSVAGLVGAIVDITEQKKMEEAIRQRIALESAIAQSSRLFVSSNYVDINKVLQIMGEFVSVNRVYIFKFRDNLAKIDNTNEWCDSRTVSQIENLQNLDSNNFPWWMTKLKSGENIVISNVAELSSYANQEKEILQAQGILSLLVVPINSTDGELVGFMGFDDTENFREWSNEDINGLRVISDMVGVYWERQRVENRLQYFATHDVLTKIPNRYFFEKTLKQAIIKAKNGVKSALLFIDLDNFKIINDTLGHSAGDELLIALVEVFKKHLRESDFLSRLGGDEFAVLLEGVSIEETEDIAEKLRRSICESKSSLISHEFCFSLSISIGIIMIDGAVDYHKYLSLADIALYAAKEGGRNRIVVAQPDENLSEKLTETNRLVGLVKNALTEDMFELYFQPIVRVSDGEVTHHEALLRLHDKTGQIILPNKFIPVAEHFGLMSQIDCWVVQKALEDMRKYPEIRLFINISGVTLSDEVILDEIETKIRNSGIEPSRIGFEITETAVVKDLLRAERWIRRLKDLGCLFALDDFGTGFSSLSYLRILPVDYIKIDGSFVSNLDKESVHRALVQAIHTIANTLGRKTIAEFVENEDILKELQIIGIDCGQGFFLGKPDSKFKQNII